MLRRNNAAAKPTLNLGGLGLDQSDDEITNSEKKQNPFDEGKDENSKESSHQDNMKNLFFHKKTGLNQDGSSTADFGK